MSERELTYEERANIRKLALARPDLMYGIIEEILKALPNGDEVLWRAVEKWQS